MTRGGGQRAKNPVSVSALLTGKFLRVRKIFARMVYNVSLKGPILSRQCKSHPDNKTVQMVSILSGQFQYCPDISNTVRTTSILSGRFQYCPDVFKIVRTFSIMSGRLQYFPDGFNTVRTDSTLSRRFQYCSDGFNTVRTVSILSKLS